MKTPFPRLFALGLGAIILLGACSPPAASTPEPLPTEPPPSEPPPLTEAPVELAGPENSLGDTLPWLDGSTLVYIPAGEFIMGGVDEDNPGHTVGLSDFWIYRTEVTNRMYARCVSLGKCSPPAVDPSYPDYLDPALDDHPVVGLDWAQSEAYCVFAGGHLPTEAQWEKAARGPDGDTYPWGEGEPACDLLNFADCVGDRTDVLEYPDGRSDYEVFDMAGNVFEWVQDWYQANYYGSAPAEDPLGPETGQFRSVRGSAYMTEPDKLASALRYYLEPEKHRADLGFRCVVADPYRYAPPCEVVAYVQDQPSGGPVDPLSPDPTTCEVDPPSVNPVTDCKGKVIRLVNINYSPPDADVTYSSDATCSESPGQIACWGYGGETIDYKICTSCDPVPT